MQASPLLCIPGQNGSNQQRQGLGKRARSDSYQQTSDDRLSAHRNRFRLEEPQSSAQCDGLGGCGPNSGHRWPECRGNARRGAWAGVLGCAALIMFGFTVSDTRSSLPAEQFNHNLCL